MQFFYAPDIQGEFYTLSEDESLHCVRVLRLLAGAQVALIDGCGTLYTAQIVDANPKRCQVRVVEVRREFGKRAVDVHLAIAPTKNIDRLEWCFEKCTELGINTLTPLLCERSERKVVNVERLQKVVIAAVKQSVKAYVPRLNPLVAFREFVVQPTDSQLFIAYCGDNLPHLRHCLLPGRRVTVLVGPEGDFSPTEIQLAQQFGYQPVSLGPSRLRTETAGVVACHLANLFGQ